MCCRCYKTAGRESTAFPSSSSKTTIPIAQYKTRHPNGSSFLCTRVQSPDEDDYKKLTRVMQYLWAHKDLTITLEPGEQQNWWVDSSYAVHPDMCSHSGIVLSLGKGAAYSTSCKQNRNQIQLDDAMGQILWTRNFLIGQGINTTTATNIYQDNKSTILLAENGKGSSSRCTKHLDVRYFCDRQN